MIKWQIFFWRLIHVIIIFTEYLLVIPKDVRHRGGKIIFLSFEDHCRTPLNAVQQFFSYTGWHKKNGNFWKPNKTKTFLWRKHAVDRSTYPWLLNGEVVCSSRSLFRSAANCTWLPLSISKVPVFLFHPV